MQNIMRIVRNVKSGQKISYHEKGGDIMWDVIIKIVFLVGLLALTNLIRNLYKIYTLFPKKSADAGFIAWGIISEAVLMIQIIIQLVK